MEYEIPIPRNASSEFSIFFFFVCFLLFMATLSAYEVPRLGMELEL